MTIVAVQIGVPSLVNTPVPGNVPLVLITIVATLIANYLERESRLNYLQRLLTRIQGARLAAMVVQLHDLAQRDPLTGLANRRGIDAQFEASGADRDRRCKCIGLRRIGQARHDL